MTKGTDEEFCDSTRTLFQMQYFVPFSNGEISKTSVYNQLQ
jgi:hypothetical protein